MPKFSLIPLLLVPLPAASNHAADAADTKAVAFLEKKIRPVLVQKCYRCHSVEAAKKNRLKGGLQLDTRAGIRAGGDSGAAVIPGKPKQGTLLSALRQSKADR